MMDEKRRAGLIALCQDMIRSYSVTGSEKEIARLLCDHMKAAGYDEAWVDDQGNVIGKICGKGHGKIVLLDGHIDTVEVSDRSKWQHGPFDAEIDNGRIYGRGAADMKGALCAMICAAGWLAQDNRPEGDVYVTGTAMEEIAEGCSLAHILKDVPADIVVIGEATMLNLNIGQRGRGEIMVRTKGKPAHSSNPEVGVNAVYKMMSLLQQIREIPVKRHEVLGDGIMELTDIISSPYPGASVVPELCSVTFDRRLLIGETEESVLEQIREKIAQLKNEDNQFDAEAFIAGMDLEFYTGYKTSHSKFAPAWCLDREKHAALIDTALSALRGTGLDPAVSSYKFCTNGSASAGQLGIPTIGFGPCAESQAHVVDEYIEIAQLEQAALGYYALIGALARM
jgi:putative selenium metabolism hydrolase